MNLHEYQAKELLASFGVLTQRGVVANSIEEATKAAQALTEKTGTTYWMVKAQIHAGGRGKGGGVKLAKSMEEVKNHAENILGMMLKTPQTAAEGKKVYQVLIAEDVYYPGEEEPKEYYISILLNRESGKNMFVYSTEGGMDIEQVAEKTPELIFKEEIDPLVGFQSFQARKIAFNLGLSGKKMKEMMKFVTGLHKAYTHSDASLFEINPVLSTSDQKVLAVDAKVVLDENALFRHPELAALRDEREEIPTEVAAKASGLNYVELDGNIACMVNGAGLAMSTMDLIKQSGGEPANFLDVGGSADAVRVKIGFDIILKNPKVKAILVNIFGGIVRCDRIAKGIIEAYENMQTSMKVPIIVRLQGTNAIEAKSLIDASGLDVISVTEFKEATEKVQEVLRKI